MGICPSELIHLVIRPTLKYLGEDSEDARFLLMATAAMESELGFHLVGNEHKGIGVYQISAKCHRNVWDKYLVNNPELASKVRGLASQHEFLANPHQELATNLRYATAIAWLIYKRKTSNIPKAQDLDSVARFWRRHFHSRPHATVERFLERVKPLLEADCRAA